MVNTISCIVDTLVIGESVIINSDTEFYAFYEDDVLCNLETCSKFEVISEDSFEDIRYTPTTIGVHTVYFSDNQGNVSNILTFTVNEEEHIDLEFVVNVNVQVNYGTKKIPDVGVILTHTATNTNYISTTDGEGNCTVEIIGDSLEELLTDYLVEVDCVKYSTNTNVFTATSESNELLLYLVKLDDCQNQILTNKQCKYFHHDPYMTPNNFDLYFDHSQIPSNAIKESPNNLLKRLQRTMPLTKILHLNLQSEQDSRLNGVNISTSAKLKFNTRIENVENMEFRIVGEWQDYSESTTNTDFVVGYTYNNDKSIPVTGAIISLVNSEYPLITYSKMTNDVGQAQFIELPCGSYYIIGTYNNKSEQYHSSYEITQSGGSMEFYLGNPTNIDVTGGDYSEVEVTISKESNDPNVEDPIILDTVKLNKSNNYSALTIPLPVFDEDNNKIDYDFNPSNKQGYCLVSIEEEDSVGIDKKEEVLL